MASVFQPSVCPHDCPSTCALDVEVLEGGRLGRVRGSHRNSYTAGVICAKVARYADRFDHPDRLSRPLRRTGPKGSGQFAPISWDEALDEIATRFSEAEHDYGPESVWPYYYAGTMGLVHRDSLNRLTHAKRYSRFHGTICSTIAKSGWRAGHGTLRGTPATQIGEHSDLVVIWGGNPVHTNVNLMTHISRARKNRGARLVVIDPYATGTAVQADVHLALAPGTDAALACGVMHVLFKEGYADWDFLNRHSDDPAGLEAHLQSRTPQWAAAITGLQAERIIEFARLYGRSAAPFVRYGYGFTRSRNGAVNMHAASCLPVVKGAWRVPGGGGLYDGQDANHLDRSMIMGLDVVDQSVRLLDQCALGRILLGDRQALAGGPPVTAMIMQSTNPINVVPDLHAVRQGLARDDLFLCVHEQFMTETAAMADIVLPATMFLEHDDIYQASSHNYLHIGRKLFEPHGECRSNHWVVRELATRVGAEHPGFAMSDWELIDDLLRRSGWPDAETVDAAGGINTLDQPDRPAFENGFAFADGRFRFCPKWDEIGPYHKGLPKFPDHLATIEQMKPETPFRLVTAPARNYLNTSFTETPTSKKKEGRPKALVHPDVLSRFGVEEGGLIRIGNARGSILLHAAGRNGMQETVIVVESIWPNAAFIEGIGINALVGADPVPPLGGAAFHDTAVWLSAEPSRSERSTPNIVDTVA